MHAGEPRGRHQRMHRAALAGLVAQIADDGELVLEPAPAARLMNSARNRGPSRRRRPLLHHRAVREVEEAQARLRGRSGVRPAPWRPESSRPAAAATRPTPSAPQHGAARQMSFGDEHRLPPLRCRPARRAWVPASATRQPPHPEGIAGHDAIHDGVEIDNPAPRPRARWRARPACRGSSAAAPGHRS